MFKLEEYEFPIVTEVDRAFPTLGIQQILLQEALRRKEKTGLTKGIKKFNELFYSGGKVKAKKELYEDLSSWKNKALTYALCMMGSWQPKHEHKEAVCGMIFEECLEL